MHATIRRYDGVDENRTEELTRKVGESLVPRLSRLPGFTGYYLIEAGNGVMSSIGFFDTVEQGEEATRVIAAWVNEQELAGALPNPPKITSGEVTAHLNGRVLAI